ncbi:MAG: ATP-binding protein [Bacteroidaceae bacterium]|nr:ATP-binding protein [Bacteroidaceae bacterium]
MKNCRIITPEDIEPQTLYYNEEESAQMSEITKLLLPKNYEKVARRMRRLKINRGLVFLFSGASGTGKTQGVYQIARACKRKIVLSEFVRSRYVGQSEMLMREFFDDYDRLTQAIIRRGENAPILLFDEADGLFTRRGTVKHSSDIHENALQDLLLTLIGGCKSHCIIFMTTNIISNIDDAFMRRILYHVHLTPPQMKVRENIIRSIFPSLSDKDVYTLAAEELTGANWNNVYRKSQINYIINNDRVTAASLLSLCKLETHKDKPQRIGFC